MTKNVSIFHLVLKTSIIVSMESYFSKHVDVVFFLDLYGHNSGHVYKETNQTTFP